MTKVCIFLIRLYQRIPGRWHSYCKFKPSCSEYAILVYQEFGFFKGSFLTFKRILRCNCFSKGGYDPVPIKEDSNS